MLEALAGRRHVPVTYYNLLPRQSLVGEVEVLKGGEIADGARLRAVRDRLSARRRDEF
jgi:hypothetical protein